MSVVDISQAARQDFSVVNGDTVNLTLKLKDSAGTTIDLTGSTFAMQIFHYGDTTRQLHSITGTVDTVADTVTFPINTTFWNKVKGKTAVYYRMKRTISAETKTHVEGNLYLDGRAGTGACGCVCSSVELVTPTSITVEFTNVGLTGPQGSDGGGLRMETVFVGSPAYLVTDDKLKGSSLFPIIYVEGAPYRYTQYGIVWDGDAGTLDFTGYGQQVSGYIDFQIQD